LDAADCDDVVQATWAAALAHIGRVREAEAFGGWLAVTARRECLRVLARRRREAAADGLELHTTRPASSTSNASRILGLPAGSSIARPSSPTASSGPSTRICTDLA